jgi:hypothetical protein
MYMYICIYMRIIIINSLDMLHEITRAQKIFMERSFQLNSSSFAVVLERGNKFK